MKFTVGDEHDLNYLWEFFQNFSLSRTGEMKYFLIFVGLHRGILHFNF